jgi:hypothetical protein
MWDDMGVNKHRPHVFVLPEDDANRQIAVGFAIAVAMPFSRQIYVLPVAGGWTQVLERFLSDEVVDMEACPDRYMVLLIDFDGIGQRLNEAGSRIPDPLRERVFILGVWSEPEELKKTLGSYEAIGSAMARDCREGTDTTWDHNLLRHNAGELARLRKHVGPILF